MRITGSIARRDYIPVCSKVQPHQTEEEVRREIPVNAVPGLRDCIDRILEMELPATCADPGNLFRKSKIENRKS